VVPRSIRGALLRGLERDPARRFSSMDELLAELAADDRSAGGRDLLGAIWNAGRREQLRATFAATQHPRAADDCARIEALLDAWTERWVASYDETRRLRRTRERSEQALDRRDACLERRLRELGGLVTALVERLDAASTDAGI